ncbi:MAG: LysE family transporter [Sphingobacteriaceae bacterium]|nr:LysE family transporter [Cytophagaceae bacterium]
MLSLLLIFSLTFLISFAGSVHPGPVNLSVVHATLRQGLSAGLRLAAGGCVPEIVYGLLAVQGVNLFERVPGLFNALRISIVPILLGLGVLTILRARRPTAPKPDSEAVARSRNSFGRGLVLSLLNPQLLPFWMVILVSYHGYPMLRVSTLAHQAAFVTGTSLGAFGILYVYAQLTHRHRTRIERYLHPARFDLVMGLGFVGMALWQGLRLWFF